MSVCRYDDSPWCAPGTCVHCDDARAKAVRESTLPLASAAPSVPIPRAVLEECLDAVLTRVRWYEARNKDTPTRTLNALNHLCRKLGKDPTEL